MKIVYYSGSGNTEKMANLIAEGIKEEGKTAELINVSSAGLDVFDNEDIVILGCPAMGDEVLEEAEFEHFMQEEDYTFVTLDSDDAMLTDAVIVDVDGGNDLSDAVMIDESIDASDFITLSDDTIMLSDADMLDTYSTDIDGSDISFIL